MNERIAGIVAGSENIGVLALSADCRVVSANRAVARMLDRAEGVAAGTPLAGFCHPDDCDPLLDGVNRVFSRDSEGFGLRLRLRTTADRNLWVEVVASPLLDRDGRCSEVVCIVTDISRLHRETLLSRGRTRVLELLYHRHSLQEICAEIATFIESIEEGVFCSILLLDREKGRLYRAAAPSLPEFYNQAIEGMRIGDGVGSCGTAAFRGERVIVTDIRVHPYWSRVQELVARTDLRACWSEPIFSSSGQVLGTFALYYTTPREPNEMELQLIRSAAELAALAIDHKRSESAHLQSEAQLHSILSAISDTVMVVDATGRLSFCQIAEGALPFDAADGLGHRIEKLFPEPVASMMTTLLERNRIGEVGECEYAIDLPTGRRWESAKFSPRFVAGEYDGSVAVVRDITRLKRTEETLRTFDRMKNEFISTAAHELRTPLTAIMGYAELLNDKSLFCSFSEDERVDFVSEIYGRGESLARIVDELLDISRIEGGYRLEVQPMPTQVLELAARVVRYFRRNNPETRIALFTGNDLPETLKIDGGRIVQVLENLVSNAIKYSPRGSEVAVRIEVEGDVVLITVADAGRGMNDEEVAKAFDKFYRANSSDTAVSGLGIGLSIAREIVEAHGGRIWLESRSGEGTCARFTLPLER